MNSAARKLGESLPDPTMPEGYKRCTTCARAFPDTKEHFPADSKHHCRECHREKRRKNDASGREKKREAASVMADKAIKAITGGQLEAAPHITEYLDEMVRQVGGLKQLVSRHLHQVAEAEAARPGSQTVLKFYEHVGKLILYSTQHRSTAPDAHSLSDDELADELKENLVQLLMQKLGGDVTPEQMIQLFSPSTDDDESEAEPAAENERD